MAWKNIKQCSLGNALIVEHKALTKLDDVQSPAITVVVHAL